MPLTIRAKSLACSSRIDRLLAAPRDAVLTGLARSQRASAVTRAGIIKETGLDRTRVTPLQPPVHLLIEGGQNWQREQRLTSPADHDNRQWAFDPGSVEL
jgi:hypothetical protein